ncbi:MAG TPA: SWIM zinc finger family protein, partial [Armatimonadota bacterium]|nr:SWIM zinc finger family protein [Armatimonadota bacterium]
MPKRVIIAEDVGQVIRRNRYMNRATAKGYELYWHDRTELTEYEADHAEVLVVANGRKMFEVQIGLAEGVLQIKCSCGKEGEDLCEHGAAACFALEYYLKLHPPFVWQSVLKSVMQTPQVHQDQARNDRILVFNLRLHPDGGAFLNPYLVHGKALPEELPEDAVELARYLHAHRTDWEARGLFSRSSINKVHNASAPVLAAANLTLSSIYYGTDAFKELLPQLPYCPLFLETEERPLAVPLSIDPTPVPLSLFTAHDAKGIHLILNLQRAGTAAPEPLSDFHILSRQPLWILVGDTISPVEESASLLDLFRRRTELLIPEADTAEFLTEFLTPLAERMQVEGDF